MCIAIPPPLQKNRTGHSRVWRWLSASPLRLLGLSATLQLLLLVVTGLVSEDHHGFAPGLFAAFGTLVFGHALYRLPHRLHASPVSYPLSVGLFVLLSVGGPLSAMPTPGLALSGQGLVAVAWILGLRALRWKVYWARGARPAALLLQNRLLLVSAGAVVGLFTCLLLGLDQWQTAVILVGAAALLSVEAVQWRLGDAS